MTNSDSVNWAGVWLAALVIALLPGCVRRRLMVRSNPPGAMVYVDNQPIGTTPCATSFTYYGTREIRLVKPGFETLTVKQPIPAPWYEFPPLDFASENIAPQEIQDFRTVTYNMTPQVVVPTPELLARANQLRLGTQQGAALPAGAELATGQATLNPPMITTPGLPLPAPAGPALGSPMWAPTPASPELIIPMTPGPGTLPPGGVPVEALPAP